jgi:hypothetical protein
MLISDCCGMPMDPIQAEHGICPECLDHCETIDTETEDESDES